MTLRRHARRVGRRPGGGAFRRPHTRDSFMTRPSRFRGQHLLALALLLAAGAPARAEENASEARMRKDLTYLASDECEGRGVETRGINKAAEYVAAGFRNAGLKPGGAAGSFFQPFAIAGPAERAVPNTLKLVGPQGQEIELTYARHFMPLGMSGTGRAEAG